MCDTSKLTTPHQPLTDIDRAIARALATALVREHTQTTGREGVFKGIERCRSPRLKEVQAGGVSDSRTLPHTLVERAIQAWREAAS
jgi:hypothetical protein